MEAVYDKESLTGYFDPSLHWGDDPPLLWAYVRSDGPEDRQILEDQFRSIEDYCKIKNLANPIFVVEETPARKPLMKVSLRGSSDEEIQPRPLFTTLVGWLLGQSNAHLIVWKLDRISSLLSEQEVIIELFRQRKRSLTILLGANANVMRGEFTGDPLRDSFRSTFRMISLYQEYIKDPLHHDSAWAMAVTSGRPIYGYKVSRGMYEIDPQKASVVRYIYFLRICLRMSIQRITWETAGMWDRNKKKYDTTRINRVLQKESIYRGWFSDSFGVQRYIPHLKLLPDTEKELYDTPRPEVIFRGATDS